MKFLIFNLTIFTLLAISTVSSFKRSSRHHRLKEHEQSTTTTTSSPSPSTKLPYNSNGQGGACEGWWCGAGKECEIGSDGLARCGCIRECPSVVLGAKSCVVGTDGRLYKSHCELHRVACLSSNSQLAIDHSNSCLNYKNNNNDKHNKLDRKTSKWGHPQHSNKDFTPEDFPSTDYLGAGTRNHPVVSASSTKSTSGGDKPVVRRRNNNKKWADSSKEDDDEEDIDDDIDDDDTEEEDLDDDILMGDDAQVVPQKTPLQSPTKVPKKGPVARKSEFLSDSSDSASSSSVLNSESRSSRNNIREIRRDSCSPQEYEILKDNLLLYNHERMIGGVRNFKAAMEAGNPSPEKIYFDEAIGDGPEAGKDYLLSLMFSHFDRNNNGALEYDELHRVDMDESLTKLASGCSLVHLLRFDDSDHNGQLNINEFYTAFNKLYSVSVISLDKALETTHVTATVGDNVEIKCDVSVSGSPSMPIVWRRYSVDLSSLNQDEQIRVFPDGTLYLNKIQLLHAGNYSCHAQRNQEVVQTHVLSVQTLPDVKVMPHIVWEKPGQEVSMECRVMGEPFPVVQWLKNDDPLPLDMGDKYAITGDGIRLTLKDIYFSDTGAYMCKAQNSAGKRLDIASLVVIDQQTPSTVQMNESQFMILTDKGISVYDPTNCRLQHQIQGTDIIPGTQQEYVCGDRGVACEWGRAIRVSSSYVYASQPKMDRVLVISTTQMVVVDVVPTDRYPVELHYVPHLDQVWVECWRSDEGPSQKTLQVIREGKEKRKHHTVHPEPIDSHFDLVDNLFLPPDAQSSSQFRYAYVSHKNGRGLYKMDLIALRYTKSVDLTPYNCVPQHIQFSALYGMVIVECFEPVTNRPTGQLVLDALTDSVVYYKGDRFGRPYLSPDSRKLVTVSHSVDGTTLLLQLIRENGLEFSFDVKTSLNISDVTFFPSQRSHTYDLYASSVDKDDVLFVDLESGKVEMVSGVSSVVGQSSWNCPSRSISSQGLFSKYLATPSADSVFVLNGQSHTINCQIGGLPNPHLVVWL